MASRNVDEYLVCVPKHGVKNYNVMRFNAGDKVDIRNWISGSLSRNMSAKKIYEEEEVYPEYGEGSEYGRKQREEARRLKYGIRKSKFKESDQPWDLTVTTVDNQTDVKKKVNGKSDVKPNLVTRDYCGKKEGGIGEGSMYFIFTQRPDFTFEAHAVEDWYNFRRKVQHRTLTDEEAEAAWDKRDKIVNHLNYMARKRLHINEEEEEGADDAASNSKDKAGTKKEKAASLTIHDNEDYALYMSGSSSEEENEEEEKSSSKKKKPKKSKPDAEDETPEGNEDSDDGEHEGTEIAYASDISSENEESNDAKLAPRGLDEISSSSSSEDEEENKEKLDLNNIDSKQDKNKGSDDSSGSGDSDSDIDNDDTITKSALFMQKTKNSPKDKLKGSRPSSRSSTPTSETSGPRTKMDSTKKLEDKGRSSPFNPSSSLLGKRQAPSSGNETSSKQLKLSQGSSRTSTPTKELLQQGITEEAVRRYLTLKPITTKDLLKKFKTKKTGLSSEKIVEKVANILKKLNPQQSKINGKMHLFLKTT